MFFSKKNIRIIVGLIIVVFVGLLIVYPLAFNTSDSPAVEEPQLQDPIIE